MKIREGKTIGDRKKIIERIRGISISAIGVYAQGLEKAADKNCENMIGAVQIPIGIAGPLKIDGDDFKNEYYIPLATTEGALVASVNRGCKAITLSAGAKVIVENIGITRGPVFETSGLIESFLLKKWLNEHFTDLKNIAKNLSAHLTLLNLDTSIVGRNVFIRLYFDTKDAMGMNMVTFATEKLAEFIEEKTQSRCISLAGNFDIDKKPAWLNFIKGRGKKVWAEVVIKRKIIEEVLKTTPEKIHEVTVKKCMLGSALSGSLGFNAHFANVIAGIFLATGQDGAHITEGSLGITSTDIIGGDLYITVYLPDLVIGTVGGGTGLPSQKEALDILGISGGNDGKNSMRFAAIIGATVLAGELSLLSSLSEGSLAYAHRKLARGEKNL